MRQLLWMGLVLAAVFVVLGEGGAAYAQEVAPEEAAAGSTATAGTFTALRRQGLVPLTIVSEIILIVLFLSWVAIGDWVNRDSQIFNLGYKKWNPIVFFPFAMLAILLIFVPVPAWARWAVLLVALIA